MNTQHNNVPRLAPLTLYPFKHFKGTLYIEGTFADDDLQISLGALDWAVKTSRRSAVPLPADGFALIKAGAQHPLLFNREDVQMVMEKMKCDVPKALVLLNIFSDAMDIATQNLMLGGAHERCN